MERDLVDRGVMGVVVLDKSLTADIPNFDFAILCATGNASSIGVEFN